MVCAFTGHRPEKLPWGGNEEDERCLALKLRLRQLIREQMESGVTTFLCGMARGCDLYFAEAVLEEKGDGIRLEAWLPCPSQADRWPEKERLRYERILKACDGVYILEPEYSDGCMLRRNRAMVDRADRIISVWDGSSGGTGAAVRYAKRMGVTVIPVWL